MHLPPWTTRLVHVGTEQGGLTRFFGVEPPLPLELLFMLSYPPDEAGKLVLLLLSWWSGGGLAAAGGIPALPSMVGTLPLDFDRVLGVLSFFEPPTAARIDSGGNFFVGCDGWDAMVEGKRRSRSITYTITSGVLLRSATRVSVKFRRKRGPTIDERNLSTSLVYSLDKYWRLSDYQILYSYGKGIVSIPAE